MSLRRLFLLFLTGVAVALTPLAYASPPDPSWIRGVYDDGDYDDVLVLLTSSVGVAGPLSPCDLLCVPTTAMALDGADQQFASLRSVSANPSRAPPAL